MMKFMIMSRIHLSLCGAPSLSRRRRKRDSRSSSSPSFAPSFAWLSLLVRMTCTKRGCQVALSITTATVAAASPGTRTR